MEFIYRKITIFSVFSKNVQKIPFSYSYCIQLINTTF